jgi:ribosomal protein L14
MIQKSTNLFLADKCNIYTGNTFHIYKGFKKTFGYAGDFVKFSARLTNPSLSSLKGEKLVGILNRLSKKTTKLDASQFFCKFNSVVCLKKRLTPRGKEIFGPCNSIVKRKKFLASFSGFF